MKIEIKEDKTPQSSLMEETEANITDAWRTAGSAVGIMLRGVEVPQVKPPQNILLATKSCPRI